MIKIRNEMNHNFFHRYNGNRFMSRYSFISLRITASLSAACLIHGGVGIQVIQCLPILYLPLLEVADILGPT